MTCVEKIIKKDWIHPLTNEKLTEKDIIPMQMVSKVYNIKRIAADLFFKVICFFENLLFQKIVNLKTVSHFFLKICITFFANMI